MLLFCNCQLEKLINANSTEVDWERSFYLDLAAHTSYIISGIVQVCFCGTFAKILQASYALNN